MEKSKLNRFQYNERIYNYKHGLVNSAENQTVVHSGVEGNQTIEHSSENEEHIEHALPGTPGSYDYRTGRSKGWEWDNHKYIRKEERADGTIAYIYEDGSSRIDDTNKVLGKPMRTAATGGTPGGSYTPPMKKTPSSNPVDTNAVNNSTYIPTQTNLGNGFKGTPGGSTYRKPVAGTPTGALGNGVTNSQLRDTFKANLQMGQGGTPTGLTGTYKEIDPSKVDQASAVLTAQGYKKEADKNAAAKELYNGQGGTPTGLTGTAKPMSEQAYNLAAGKGTPGGVNGPDTPKNAYAADIWSSLKNNIKEGYGAHTTELANQANDRMSEIAAENRLNLAQNRREEAEKAGQASIAEQQASEENVPTENSPVFENIASRIDDPLLNKYISSVDNNSDMTPEEKLDYIFGNPYIINFLDTMYQGVIMSDSLDIVPVIGPDPNGGKGNVVLEYTVVSRGNDDFDNYFNGLGSNAERYMNLAKEHGYDITGMIYDTMEAMYNKKANMDRYK